MRRTARPGWLGLEVPLLPRVIARSLTPSRERFNDFDLVQTGVQVLSTQAIPAPEGFWKENSLRSLTTTRNSTTVGAFARFRKKGSAQARRSHDTSKFD